MLPTSENVPQPPIGGFPTVVQTQSPTASRISSRPTEAPQSNVPTFDDAP